MPLACAHCHRVDAMQAGLDKSQCLACGGLTYADGPKATATIAAPVEFLPVQEYPEPANQHPDRRVRPGSPEHDAWLKSNADGLEAAPEPEPAPEVVAEVAAEEPELTPEQMAAIAAIVHPQA